MASFRIVSRFFNGTKQVHTGLRSGRRAFSSKAAGVGFVASRPLLLTAAAGLTGYGAYSYFKNKQLLTPTLYAASAPASQPSVFSQGKNHALYLWIHVKPEANSKACAKVVANLQKHVDAVCPPDLRDEDDEVWAGVGFGPNFYSQVSGKPLKNYNYPHRKGALGDMPSTGGDIFIHAKSNNVSKLFELAQTILNQLPTGSVDKFEDTYSFVYQNGRDLSGFIDGTENAADEDDRREIAVEKETGGSYVITQKWVHKLKTIAETKATIKEAWVGRAIGDSTELSRKSQSSHVTRMTGGSGFQQKKPFQIVRQSMPYGNLHDKAGLFFIGYASAPDNFEFMLDRMVGSGGDGQSDDIMKLSECVAGTYWYFPGVDQLKKLA